MFANAIFLVGLGVFYIAAFAVPVVLMVIVGDVTGAVMTKRNAGKQATRRAVIAAMAAVIIIAAIAYAALSQVVMPVYVPTGM